MTPSIRSILFDKDGTLIDSFGGWINVNHRVFDELRSRYGGIRRREDLDRLLGIDGGRVLPGGLVASGTEEQIYRAHHLQLGGSAPPWEEFLPEVRSLSRKWFQRERPTVQPVGRVGQTLKSLREAGYRLGIATSDSYENAFRDLAEHGGETIEFWATSDRLSHPKPHPESIFLFSQFTALPVQAVAFVGDSDVDLQAARAAGAGLFVAIRSSTCPPGVLAQADAVLDTVEGLPTLLESRAD